MPESISNINSSSNNFHAVSQNTREIPKDDLELITKYLSEISEEGISIIKTSDEIKTPENKSFFHKLFDKLTGKTNKTKEISKEELAELIDIERMACLPN